MSRPIRYVWDQSCQDYFLAHIQSHHGELIKAFYLLAPYLQSIKKGEAILYLRAEHCRILRQWAELEELLFPSLGETAEELEEYIQLFCQTPPPKELAQELRPYLDRYLLSFEEAQDIAQIYLSKHQPLAQLSGHGQWLPEWLLDANLYPIKEPVWVIFAQKKSKFEGAAEYSLVISCREKKLADIRLI
ncbi:hypothetical protein [Saprospira grandis]|uniref:hypothetical protein n=1 Tax=Saprospira grandis TaxID=1008 RepID=UPI0022DD5458|nr:hypothetical protein [Saprospira grandis]WBM73842.1 hypothetical protein OP864_12695 [Saprospira grandis]